MIDKIKKFFGINSTRIKVPTILQMEATECGAASLSMILAHYNLWLPLEKLRQECGVNRDGSKASCVIRAARNRGCTANGYRWNADRLKEVGEYPLIIHWEFNHFVVMEGIKGDTVYLNDPAMGRRTVKWEEFRTSYTGVALHVVPNENFKPEGERYNIFKAVAEKLAQDKWAVLFILLLNFGMIIPGLASPVFSQIFLDDILAKKHTDWMFNFCLAMTISFVVCGVMTWLQAVILTRWQKKLTLADSASFFWHLLRLPMAFFNQRFAGEVASRVNYNESIAGVLSGPAALAILNFLVAIFYLLLLLQYHVGLTLIGVFFSSINIIVFFALRRHLTDMNMKIQQDAGKEYGTTMNGLMMIETIKANGNEADFFAKWAGYRAKVLKASQDVAIWQMTATIVPTLLGGINGALIMTIGGFSIMDGVLTAGMFTAFQSLMGSFQEPVNSLLGLGSTLQSTEMQMQRLNDVRKYEIDDLNCRDEKISDEPVARLNGELELKDIDFGYSPLEKPLINKFSLHIEPGHWVAVVGASGSGKSTVSKIVTGIYEEWSGEVRFDGVIRRELPRAVIVNSISAVDQDVFQITGTITQNLTLFDDSVRRSDVIQAAKDACIHEDILQLEKGYDSEVSEGGLNFSGGQRQRLEIARALANNPSLLILDEATSALDPMTEQTVLENIRRRGCSCLIVAHRLSTIRDCDEIIVLDKGVVVERGTHRQMIQHDGPYKRLIEERSQEGNEEL
ncbi:MAG: NHLP family bacteriocin export ABC transporter peptidase/permease/ATPase subunit [Selenomonadaceae bacterium]|nr:NHLP family bacteriocin export ABC transporter peptidase/permease/ATPase subunit [Selenomonadaceae bacterium]